MRTKSNVFRPNSVITEQCLFFLTTLKVRYVVLGKRRESKTHFHMLCLHVADPATFLASDSVVGADLPSLKSAVILMSLHQCGQTV